jgi:dTDP-4-amino-4,6-dideoxygalactose transaminase
MAMNQKRTVPFFNYQRVYLDERQDLINILDDVGGRGAFIMQKDLNEFEKKLATYTGANHAVGVANATDGLELAWMALG